MTKYQIILKAIILSLFALNVSCTKAIIDEETPAPITKTVKYNPDIKNVMTNYCITCHSGAAASAGADLTTYAGVKFYTETGKLIQRMNSTTNPMPPSGLISPSDRQIITKWLEDGLLED